jgi:dTDP-4-dehydrorhamnose reductase
MHGTPKTIIFGKNGFLGSHLFLHNQNNPNFYFASRSKENKLVIESRDRANKELPWSYEDLMNVIHELQPDAVINAIALANAKRCEESPSLAEQANRDIPAALAIASNHVNATLVHISTDAVFGQQGSHFKETEVPQPKSVYGKTKLQGEEAVIEHASKHLIVRTNFFGHHKTKHTLFDYFYQNLLLKQQVFGYNDVLFNPIYIQDLVLGLESFLMQKTRGILHFVGDEVLTKFEFGRKVSSQMSATNKLVSDQAFKELADQGNRKSDLTLSSEVRESLYKCVFDVNLGIKDAILHAKADENGL